MVNMELAPCYDMINGGIPLSEKYFRDSQDRMYFIEKFIITEASSEEFTELQHWSAIVQLDTPNCNDTVAGSEDFVRKFDAEYGVNCRYMDLLEATYSTNNYHDHITTVKPTGVPKSAKDVPKNHWIQNYAITAVHYKHIHDNEHLGPKRNK